MARLLGALVVSFLTVTAVAPSTVALAAGKRSEVGVSAKGVMPGARPVPRGGFAARGVTHQSKPWLSIQHPATSANGGVRVTTASASPQPPKETAGPFNFLGQSVGNPYTPPDTQVAAGPGYLLEAVNDEAAVFTDAGVQVGPTLALQSFFPLENGFFYTDPRVAFDPIGGGGTWYITILEFMTTPHFASRIYMATSYNPNPSITGSWTYAKIWPNPAIPAEQSVADSQICDQPQLGFSGLIITISCNNFTPPQNFTGALTRVIDKLDLLNPGHAVVYQDLLASGDSLSPAQSYGKTGTQYVVFNAHATPNFAGGIAISGRPDSASGSSASEFDLPIQQSTLPPAADQPGTPEQIDSADNRFQVATWRNGILWTGGDDGCKPSGDTVLRSCLRLVAVNTGTMTVQQDFDLGVNGLHLMYPGVTTDGYNDMFVSFTVSGTTQFPSLEYTSQFVGEAAGTVDGIQMIAAGQGFYTDSVPNPGTHTHRWGDYGEGTPDPVDPTEVWLAGEYVPTTGTDWGTAAAEATLRAPCDSGSVVADMASPQPLTAHPTFTATVGGCSQAPEYSFWLYGKVNGTAQWVNVQPYSASNTYQLNYPGLSYGTYSIDVWMRNVGSALQYETFGLMSWVIGGCNFATTTNTSGTTYTTAAGGVACATPEFKVWMVGKGLPWTVESGTANGGWTSSPTFDASTVSGLAPGTYSIDVWVREKGVSTDPTYLETWGLSTFVKGTTACSTSQVSLVAAQASPHSTGLASVDFTAAGCGASAQYEYYLYPGAHGGYQLLRGWGAGSYSWQTAAQAAGNYSIVVWAKQAGSTTPDYDSYALYSYEFNGATSATLATNLPSPQRQSAGAITLTATSMGASTPEYSFWVLGPGSSATWVNVQPYSTANTAMWTPPSIGTFAVVVWVRQKGGGTPANAYETNAMLSFSSTQ